MRNIFLLIICISFSFSKSGFYAQTMKLEPQVIQDERTYYGGIVQNDSSVQTITTRVDGFIEELFVSDTYSLVNNGDKLYSIYSPELLQVQNEYINALTFNSNVVNIKEKLSLLGFPKNLFKRLEREKKPMNYVTFVSQNKGFVFEKNITKGQFVKKGDALYKILDLSSVWFVAKVPQSDQDFLFSFKDATLKVEGMSDSFPMKFVKVLPNLGSSNKLLEVRFLVPNEKLRLFPSMFGTATLKKPGKKMLVAPKSAVLVRKQQEYVFLKDDSGEFTPVAVETRKLSNGDYEILSGVNSGDEIAVDSLFVLDADAQNNGDY